MPEPTAPVGRDESAFEPHKVDLPPKSPRSEPERVVEPRKEVMHNVLRASLGGAKLEQPDPEVVGRLEADIPKLAYFNAAQSRLFTELTSDRTGQAEYYKTVLKPLLKQVHADFPSTDMLAIRTICASLNGTIAEGEPIDDISTIVARGIDRDKSSFNVEGIDMTALDEPSIAKYALSYTMSVGFLRMEIPDPSQAHAVFPVILVYDPSTLQRDGEDRFSVGFKNPSQASSALLGAYVLDAPA